MAVLAALFFLGFCQGEEGRPKLVKGKWAYEKQSYNVQDYKIRWIGSSLESARLLVSHKTNLSRILWGSLPGTAFAAAGRGSEKVSQPGYGSFVIQEEKQWECLRQAVDQVIVRRSFLLFQGRFLCEKRSIGYRLYFRQTKEKHLSLRLVLVPKKKSDSNQMKWNRTYLIYSSKPKEGFYGFGMQFSFFNMKGRRLPILVQRKGTGRGAQPISLVKKLFKGTSGDWYTSHAAVPHYISSFMRSLCLENYEYSIFDMRLPDRVSVKVFSAELKARLIPGSTPLELIENYTKFSGRMRPPPDWILRGAVVGIQGGAERLEAVHKELLSLGVPISAYWMQDWSRQGKTPDKKFWWNGSVNTDLYPKWKKMRQTLRGQGIRLMGYVTPFLADRAEAKPNRNFFQKAKERKYLVKNKKDQVFRFGEDALSAGLVDLSNPRARGWMKAVMKRSLFARTAFGGVSGWMADFGEGLPYNSQLYKDTPEMWHNRYADEWVKLNSRVQYESGKADTSVFFTRSGYTHSPRYSQLFWLGEQLVSWDRHDGIKTAILALVSGGISGFSINHGDIGGHTTASYLLKNYTRSDELLKRWMELAAFTAVFRTHEGSRPEDNRQIDSSPENLAFFTRFAKIYSALYEYRKKLILEAVQRGRPLVRHLFLHYPQDSVVRDLSYEEFLLGSDLLVAPVLDSGKEKVRVYFPSGEWVHLWSGRVYNSKGQWEEVAAPLGEPAVFFKKGSIEGENIRKNFVSMGLL